MNNKDISIVFMGTPEYAAKSLEELIKHFSVKLVVTQPDRPKGRGKKVLQSEVKEVAIKNNIEVVTPDKIKDSKETIDKIRDINPDFIVVVAFGQILPKEVLNLAKIAPINLHASLLPDLRGAAPIQASILKGDKITGNTTMFMNEGLDTGDMLLKSEIKILDDMTFGELHNALMEDGKDLLVETIIKQKSGQIDPIKQDETKATYVKKIDKSFNEIDLKDTAINIKNKVRALNPKPLAHLYLDDVMMKIGEVTIDLDKDVKNEEIGTVVGVSKKGIKVRVKDGYINILSLQLPGKKLVSVGDYLNGNKLDLGRRFKVGGN